MAKWGVRFRCVTHSTLMVEADSEAEALKKFDNTDGIEIIRAMGDNAPAVDYDFEVTGADPLTPDNQFVLKVED